MLRERSGSYSFWLKRKEKSARQQNADGQRNEKEKSAERDGQESVKRKKDGDSRSVEDRKSSSYDRKRGDGGGERYSGRREEQYISSSSSSSKAKGKSVGDVADLRQALDRRRSDREE